MRGQRRWVRRFQHAVLPPVDKGRFLLRVTTPEHKNEMTALLIQDRDYPVGGALPPFALMRGRLHVTIEDIEAVAPAVLRHRIIPNFNADAEGITVEQIVEKIVTMIPRGKGERLL